MRRLSLAYVVLVVVLAPVLLSVGVSRAVAAEEDPAEALIRHGVELRKSGDDQAARLEFRRAYELGKTPRSAGQLGLCEQALGRWAEADQHLAEALERAADPWIKKNRTLLERSLTLVKTHVGRVEIAGAPTGAEVLVNGHLVGKLPLMDAIPVNSGVVDVELRAPGYRAATRTMQIQPGQTNSVVLRLDPETSHAAAGAPKIVTAPVVTSATNPPLTTPATTPAPMAMTPAPRPVALNAVPPANTTPTSTSIDLQARSEPVATETSTPLYQKPWFWIAVGAGVAVAGGIGIAVATAHTEYPSVRQMGTFANPGN